MNLLGNRVADRKYQQPTTQAGSWTGLISSTHSPFQHKSTTGKKWAKFVTGLQWVRAPERGGQADTTRLRQVARLEVHITKIYPLGRSYLKSFFNAIEAFRYGRDVNGWWLARQPPAHSASAWLTISSRAQNKLNAGARSR